MPAPASRYLEVRSSPLEQRRVSQRLLELGCIAIDERADGWVLAYAETDSALTELARVLRQEFDAERVAERPLDDDWELAFIRSLEPVALTPELWVAPRNNTQGVPAAVRCLLLEPAFAFGFGEHPTTRLIARWLRDAVTRRTNPSVLDFGCGTGILALVALAFGAKEAVGLDIDPRAVDAARHNAELNSFSSQCGFSCDPLVAERRTFDLVVANVDSGTLVDQAAALTTRMSVGGALALTGFLREDVPRVSLALARQGLQVREIASDEDWSLVANWAPHDSA